MSDGNGKMARPSEMRPYVYYKNGALQLFVDLGLQDMSINTVIEYCKICDTYLKYKASGFNYTRSIDHTAEKMNVSDAKVKKAISRML